MAARSPEDICSLFQQYMAEGKLEELLSIYDTDAVFLSQSGELKKGRQGMREVLAPLVAAHTSFNYKVIQIIQSGDIALMHTLWEATLPQPTSMHAIEVARRRSDGTWCWLIGDPFTVSRYNASKTSTSGS
jgi:uncharacterized protein (TIGR02246 family)